MKSKKIIKNFNATCIFIFSTKLVKIHIPFIKNKDPKINAKFINISNALFLVKKHEIKKIKKLKKYQFGSSILFNFSILLILNFIFLRVIYAKKKFPMIRNNCVIMFKDGKTIKAKLNISFKLSEFSGFFC